MTNDLIQSDTLYCVNRRGPRREAKSYGVRATVFHREDCTHMTRERPVNYGRSFGSRTGETRKTYISHERVAGIMADKAAGKLEGWDVRCCGTCKPLAGWAEYVAESEHEGTEATSEDFALYLEHGGGGGREN